MQHLHPPRGVYILANNRSKVALAEILLHGMHSLRSKQSLRRFQLAALLAWTRFLLIPVSAGIMAWALVSHDNALLETGAKLAAGTVAIGVLLWIVGRQTRCPLCQTAVFGSALCSKHRHSKRLLGSHRLRVAVFILMRGQFTCPYCNERTSMQVRKRPDRAKPRRR